MKFLNVGCQHSKDRCSKLLYLIFVPQKNPLKLKTHTVTKFLFLFCTLFFVAETTAQKGPYDLRKPKGSEDVMIGPFSGTFTMGTADDPYGVKDAPRKEVTIKKFLIDESEVSNKEYRRFVKYVRDSIARTKLARLAEDLGLTAEDEGIGRYAFLPLDTAKVADKYYYENYLLFSDDIYAGRKLNWDVDLEWEPERYPDIYYAEVMDSLFLEKWETYNGKRMLDVKQLKYKYTWFDAKAASKNPKQNPIDFVREEVVSVYPDTLAWMKDFEYSLNEQMFTEYFWHEQYDDFPIVGVNWEQAKAYCDFKTHAINENYEKLGKPAVPAYRLPTEAEWEFAARNGDSDLIYPWEGEDLIHKNNGYKANFKPDDGYDADGEVYAAKVKDAKYFHPGSSKLYHIAGNVAEWTASTYNPDSYEFTSPLNPNYVDPDNPKKTIRGGSWKDIAYFIRVSTRDYEHKDSARAYIGFRTVRDYVPPKLDN